MLGVPSRQARLEVASERTLNGKAVWICQTNRNQTAHQSSQSVSLMRTSMPGRLRTCPRQGSTVEPDDNTSSDYAAHAITWLLLGKRGLLPAWSSRNVHRISLCKQVGSLHHQMISRPLYQLAGCQLHRMILASAVDNSNETNWCECDKHLAISCWYFCLEVFLLAKKSFQATAAQSKGQF